MKATWNMVVLLCKRASRLSLQCDVGVCLFRQTSCRNESLNTRLPRVDHYPSNMGRIPTVITVQQRACALAFWYDSMC